MVRRISSAKLTQRLNDEGLGLLDVRPMAAFNGWRLQGESRGGHIRGAIAFPLSWLNEIESDKARDLLSTKGIRQDQTIAVYGYSAEESAAAAVRLSTLGYSEILACEAGFAEWVADKTIRVDRLPRYEKLIHPEWLRDLIDGRTPENYTSGAFAVFHVNFGMPEEYARGHIPGAMHLDTNALESDADWNRRGAAELEAALLEHGIRHDTMVVLYGRDQAPGDEELQPVRKAGQIAAARAAAILMYAGVADVRLLDGGYDAWVAAGYKLETVDHRPKPEIDFGLQVPAHPEYFVDIDEAKALLRSSSGALVSIRAWVEYTGDISGYDYIGPRGRIAGAVWGNCGSDAYHMKHYRNIDNTMRDYHEIDANWRLSGITPDKKIAFYCGTGWRASEAFFYAYLMGWPRVAIYDGGWLEWSRNPSNPVEVGVPKG